MRHAHEGDEAQLGQAARADAAGDGLAAGVVVEVARHVGEQVLPRARALEEEARQLGEDYGLPVDPAARIWQLSVGEQQRVEILKALYRDVNILILDEPTAVLTPLEVKEFFEILNMLKKQGKTVEAEWSDGGDIDSPSGSRHREGL